MAKIKLATEYRAFLTREDIEEVIRSALGWDGDVQFSWLTDAGVASNELIDGVHLKLTETKELEIGDDST